MEQPTKHPKTNSSKFPDLNKDADRPVIPRTAKCIMQILEDMGVAYMEPLVVPQLLEFCQRMSS